MRERSAELAGKRGIPDEVIQQMLAQVIEPGARQREDTGLTADQLAITDAVRTQLGST